MRTEVLRARNLYKSLGGTPILEGVNFHIFPGEMVGIIGLQYSGKSMLGQILSGAERPDSGCLFMEDEPVDFSSIADAQRAGVYYMAGELQLIRSMSIAENFFVVNGRNAVKGAFSVKKHEALAREVLSRFGLDFDPRAKVREFSWVEQRKIEFVKIALQRPKLIITSGDGDYGMREAQVFRDLFQKILGMGIAILTIGNKLDSVAMECDRVYPLRDGIFGKEILKADYSHRLLFRALTGQELPTAHNTPPRRENDGVELLAAENLCTRPEGPPVSFRLHQGEIQALVVPDIAQAQELAYTLFGERQPASGWLLVEGRPVQLQDAAAAIDLGISMISGDAGARSIFGSLSLRENIALFALAREHRAVGVMPRRMADYISRHMAEHYKIPRSAWSGPLWRSRLKAGERQKVAIARWAAMRQSVYVLLNPFASADEKLADELTEIFRELAAGGAGVLLISTGLYKLQQLCDSFIFVDGEEKDLT